MDLRKFYHEDEQLEPDMYRSVQKIPQLKKDPLVAQSDDRRLTSILSQITNQRFK